MVNYTYYTKTMFVFLPVHIIPIFLYTLPTKLSTSDFVHFKAKISYTPSYPHYPHFFDCFYFPILFILPKFYFCILVINLKSTELNTWISIDFLGQQCVEVKASVYIKINESTISVYIYWSEISWKIKINCIAIWIFWL